MKALLLGVLALSISTAAMAQTKAAPAKAAPAKGAPAAQAAGDLAEIPDLVESPTWLPKARYDGPTYPAKALEANKTGQAGIICTVLPDGKMDKCFVEFEDPEGLGFGQWLVEYSKVLSVKPTDAKGSIVGKKVSYIMDFKPTK